MSYDEMQLNQQQLDLMQHAITALQEDSTDRALILLPDIDDLTNQDIQEQLGQSEMPEELIKFFPHGNAPGQNHDNQELVAAMLEPEESAPEDTEASEYTM